MILPKKFSRRKFLYGTSTAALAAGSGLWHQQGYSAESRAAAGKLNIAAIGTANRASANLKAVANENIVALCDIDAAYLQRAAARFPQARQFRDYREMLDSIGSNIDALVISTADHHHAPAAARALRAGKHVYCEKPLSHTVAEARLLTRLARQQGVATQLGTQIHARENYRRVVEMIRSGVIGDVGEVHVWVGKSWGGTAQPAEGQKVPQTLSWDLWLGPAPVRPFVAGRYHPGQWRRWWDFGQGTLGDMGCHFMDLPFWALDLRNPVRIEAAGPPVHDQNCPLGLTVRYEFAARDSMPPVRLTWHDGHNIPRSLAGHPVPADGVMFLGTDGQLYADYDTYRLFPQEQFAGYRPPAPTIPRSIGHHAEWLRACKQGTATTCNFDYSGPLTETVLLGNVAYRTGKPLLWDADSLRATNCPEAAQLVHKTYRPGWEVAAG